MLAPQAALAAHADWSVDPGKRWISVAYRRGAGWTLAAPRLVGELDTLLSRLIAEADGGAVALGADLPIGLPRAYAAHRPEAGFRPFLGSLCRTSEFFAVCATLDEVGPDRPFYPARGIAGMTRLSHALALGLVDAAALCRACDLATEHRPAGAPLFWTLGANQAGKAAISAWRSVLLPALTDSTTSDSTTPGSMTPGSTTLGSTALGSTRLRLWPFDGPFRSLLSPGTVALAETYPAEALRHLGIHLRGSKRRQTDRANVAGPLLAAMDLLSAEPDNGMRSAIGDGFGADAAGEDRFDSVLGVLCVLNVLAGHRPDTAPDDIWVRRWEGWVLGQTSLPLTAAAAIPEKPIPEMPTPDAVIPDAVIPEVAPATASGPRGAGS